MLKKYTFKSDRAGYNVLFLGAVHGNEQSGSLAMFKVIEKFAAKSLAPLKGSVTFIPICNPLAFEKNIRQIDENLNRVIKKHDTPSTYEQHIANELVDEIAASDIIIDLHSTHCPDDQPFIFIDYPDKLADKLAAAQNIKYIVEGWPEIYKKSPIQDFSTGSCAHQYGKTCLTVECGYHFSDSAEQTAYYVILSTLLALNMLEGYPAIPQQQTHINMHSFIIKEKEGTLARQFKHLDKISQNETLAVYADGQTLTAPIDGFILLPNPTAQLNTEWYYLGELK